MNDLNNRWSNKVFDYPLEELIEFEKKYGWFSITHPLVSTVTNNKNDIKIVSNLLQIISKKNIPLNYLTIVLLEIITKVLAYRDLKKGQKICIPIINGNEIKSVNFIVDDVIDLWNGMPAFGLVPLESNMASILLFRGTDISLKSKRSWASLISDLDLAGPGYSVFVKAQKKIHDWLEKVKNKNKTARMLGFSLGGVFGYYTTIFENELVLKDTNMPSVIFSPPSLLKKFIVKMNKLNERPNIITIITDGDLISKNGNFIGEIYKLSCLEKLNSIESHVKLITSVKFVLNPYQ